MKRDTSRPFRAVTLATGDAEGYRRVNSVQDAVRTLLQHWPIHDGEEYVTAVAMCLEAMLGAVCPDAARDALIRAATEAGMSVVQ